MEIINKPFLTNNSYFSDKRGHFIKIAHKEFFLKKKNIQIKQHNISFTKNAGTIRGMHYQVLKFKEIKIITCLVGKIYDVVIDLRKESKTYKKKFIFKLNDSRRSLIIPEGFAHGFQTLTKDCLIVYLHTSFYNTKFEKTINPLKLDIKWPIKNIIISKKDKNSDILY